MTSRENSDLHNICLKQLTRRTAMKKKNEILEGSKILLLGNTIHSGENDPE